MRHPQAKRNEMLMSLLVAEMKEKERKKCRRLMEIDLFTHFFSIARFLCLCGRNSRRMNTKKNAPQKMWNAQTRLNKLQCLSDSTDCHRQWMTQMKHWAKENNNGVINIFNEFLTQRRTNERANTPQNDKPFHGSIIVVWCHS